MEQRLLAKKKDRQSEMQLARLRASKRQRHEPILGGLRLPLWSPTLKKKRQSPELLSLSLPPGYRKTAWAQFPAEWIA